MIDLQEKRFYKEACRKASFQLSVLCEDKAFAPKSHHGAYQTKPYSRQREVTKAARNAIPGKATQEQRQGVVCAILWVLAFVVRRERQQKCQLCFALHLPCQRQAWLGIPLEPHPSLEGPESEFPPPIPEFRKFASEKCAQICGGKVIN